MRVNDANNALTKTRWEYESANYSDKAYAQKKLFMAKKVLLNRQNMLNVLLGVLRQTPVECSFYPSENYLEIINMASKYPDLRVVNFLLSVLDSDESSSLTETQQVFTSMTTKPF